MGRRQRVEPGSLDDSPSSDFIGLYMHLPNWSAFALTALGSLMGPAGPSQEQGEPAPEPSVQLQKAIDEAIDGGIQHLIERQHRDGSWTGSMFGSYRSGPTAFAAYALVESGVPTDAPSVRMAVEFLKANPPTMTYSAGSTLMLLAEIGGEQNEDLAELCLERLVKWESSDVPGTWAYPSGRVDLSNMQFVGLGFWAASRLGLKVPKDSVKDLVSATIELFQEEPFDRKPTSNEPRTSTRKPQAAGFRYFMDAPDGVATGSMTAAGLCILSLAREVSGKALGNRLKRQMQVSERLGLAWLGEHWDPSKNTGHTDEGEVLFYLYGLERVASLLGVDRIDGHPWYVPGAEEILRKRNDNGGWGRLHQTAYGLLFLSRATATAATGERSRAAREFLSTDSGDLRLRAIEGRELRGWLTSIEDDRAKFVDAVEWLVDSEVIARVTREEEGGSGQFAFRWMARRPGSAQLTARATGTDEFGDAFELESAPLDVNLRRSAEEWFKAACALQTENLLRPAEKQIQSGGFAAGQDPERAFDGYEGTSWNVSFGPDAWIEFVLERRIRAKGVSLSHIGSSREVSLTRPGVERIRLTVNGDDFEVDLDPDEPGTIIVPFDKNTPVKEVRIQVLKPESGNVGFAEIGLVQ